MVGVEGAKHLWVGEPSVRRVLCEVVAELLPGAAALAATWEGPYEIWSDLRPGGTP